MKTAINAVLTSSLGRIVGYLEMWFSQVKVSAAAPWLPHRPACERCMVICLLRLPPWDIGASKDFGVIQRFHPWCHTGLNEARISR
jgi:hypothetical protein